MKVGFWLDRWCHMQSEVRDEAIHISRDHGEVAELATKSRLQSSGLLQA
jgi:hypothetical protein